MKKNIILASLVGAFLSLQSYASEIKTISSVYNVQAGANFSDGDTITRTTSGGLFSAMGEDGKFLWVGKGTKKDIYGATSSAFGFVNYRRNSNGLEFNGYGDSYENYSSLINSSYFLRSEFDWNFKITGGDASLDHVFMLQEGKTSLYDITDQKWVFNSGYIDASVIVYGIYALESNHEYQYSSYFTTNGQDMAGYTRMFFENATMKVPAPATFGIFSLAFIGLLWRKKKS